MVRGHPAGGTIRVIKEGVPYACRSTPLHTTTAFRDPGIYYYEGYQKGESKNYGRRRTLRARKAAAGIKKSKTGVASSSAERLFYNYAAKKLHEEVENYLQNPAAQKVLRRRARGQPRPRAQPRGALARQRVAALSERRRARAAAVPRSRPSRMSSMTTQATARTRAEERRPDFESRRSTRIAAQRAASSNVRMG